MLLSIITINLNNASGLRKTLESVSGQTFKDFEVIVVDGKSKDESIDVIKQYSSIINKWISESDNGIYYAQNKGINMSHGEYLLFLNSGDVLVHQNILEKMAQHLHEADIVYGDLEIVEPAKRWIKKYSSPITFGYFLRDTLPHQASFIKRSMLEKVGRFDESLVLAADWKFFLDAICKHNATLYYADEVISAYDYTGISSLKENEKKLLEERKSVLINEYPRFYFELYELKTKYKQISRSRFIRFSFALRNLFSSDKIKLP